MFAAISDIHGNLEALEVALVDIERRSIQTVFCLGDVIGYGPDPRECLKMLFASEVAIMGNHEEAVMFYGEDFNPKARASLEWTKDQLNSTDHDRTENYDLWNFLGTMQQVVEDEDDIVGDESTVVVLGGAIGGIVMGSIFWWVLPMSIPVLITQTKKLKAHNRAQHERRCQYAPRN